MLKRFILTLAILNTASIFVAQTPQIIPETPATSAQLQQWLHSADPRLIAWSATLAARDHDFPTITQIPPLLQDWPILLGDASSQRRAVAALLDTLIQEKSPVDIPTINAIAQSFPAQAAILIARLPPSESQSTLHDWTYGTTGTWGDRILARLATMMLAQDPHPDPNFVAEIVAAAEDNLQVTLTSGTNVGLFGAGASCGDSLGHGIISGWPEVYTYSLEENNFSSGLTVLVELDGDRIAYSRHAENGGYGSCNGVEPLDAITRHRLIAHWLGVTPRDMPWQPRDFITIVWKDRADYQQQLGAAIETHRALLKATYDTLYKSGALRSGPALWFNRPDFNVPALPILSVTIQCSITPCPLEPQK